MKRLHFWIILIPLIAIYLNIGYGLASFVYYKVETPVCQNLKNYKPSFAVQFFEPFAFGFSEKSDYPINTNTCADAKPRNSLVDTLILFSLIWPLVISFTLILWVLKLAFLIFKLIFLGGLFKLLFNIP